MYVNGRSVRESTGTADERRARTILKQREGRVAVGLPILPRADKVRYEEIRADLVAHYRATGRWNVAEAGWRLAHLDPYFAGTRVVAIDPPRITAYVEQRQQEQAANGTINREVAVLSRMLRLAYDNGKLLRLPSFTNVKLKEAEPRAGFFEAEQFAAVKQHLPEDLQVAVTIAYTFGWRMQSEVLALKTAHLDLKEGTLALDPGMTKNDEARTVYLTPELQGLLAAQVTRVKACKLKSGREIPWLFPHLAEGNVPRHLLGTKRQDFRKAWRTACKDAGVGGKLRHDFRRTAARNLIRRGVPERVAMTITGHLTRSIFDRYNIVSPSDLRDVAGKLAGTVAVPSTSTA